MTINTSEDLIPVRWKSTVELRSYIQIPYSFKKLYKCLVLRNIRASSISCGHNIFIHMYNQILIKITQTFKMLTNSSKSSECFPRLDKTINININITINILYKIQISTIVFNRIITTAKIKPTIKKLLFHYTFFQLFRKLQQ